MIWDDDSVAAHAAYYGNREPVPEQSSIDTLDFVRSQLATAEKKFAEATDVAHLDDAAASLRAVARHAIEIITAREFSS